MSTSSQASPTFDGSVTLTARRYYTGIEMSILVKKGVPALFFKMSKLIGRRVLCRSFVKPFYGSGDGHLVGVELC
jgi:hypothetical protein